MRERGSSLLSGLAYRPDEVRQRCRTVLQSRAEALQRDSQPDSPLLEMHIPPWLWFSDALHRLLSLQVKAVFRR